MYALRHTSCRPCFQQRALPIYEQESGEAGKGTPAQTEDELFRFLPGKENPAAQQEGKGGYISPDPLVRAMMGQGTGEITSAGVETSGGGDITAQAGQTQNPATDGVAGLQKMTMADFTDVTSPVWRNVDYADTETKRQITQDTHQQMVSEGRVVQIPESTMQQVGRSFPDLRTQKKATRNTVLKQGLDSLKSALREFLGGMKETSFDFEVNGNILEATLYGTGIREVMEKVTQDKASMLYHSAEIFSGAQYLYSTPDYNGDPNIYRWNYFYTPVQIGEEVVGVRIAVRDMVPSAAKKMDSQIYSWGIKKDVTLDGGRPGQSPNTTGVSSVTSLDASVDGGQRGDMPDRSDVSLDAPRKTISLDGEGGGISRKSPGVSSDVPSINSIPQTAQDVNTETGKDMAAPASRPVDPLIADIRSKGAGQTASQPIDPLIADIRSRGVTGKPGTQTAVEGMETAATEMAQAAAEKPELEALYNIDLYDAPEFLPLKEYDGEIKIVERFSPKQYVVKLDSPAISGTTKHFEENLMNRKDRAELTIDAAQGIINNSRLVLYQPANATLKFLADNGYVVLNMKRKIITVVPEKIRKKYKNYLEGKRNGQES